MDLGTDHRENADSSPFLTIDRDRDDGKHMETKGKGVDEPDTCRICRGEGSEEEQLFYPCKCSGSIKFVHQACLMEWLSHSQKKYCELCKTPFRFTKLYDPKMPDELPAPVFIKELALHGIRTLITWLRFGLVAFVWLGWLPWSMRAVWRALFWLADGRWPTRDSNQRQATQTVESPLTQLIGNGTTPSNLTFASTQFGRMTTAQAITSALPQVLSPVTSMLNLSAGEPMVLALAKRAFFSLFFSASTSATGKLNSNPANITVSTHRQRQSSWLSDVAFLNSLTSSPTFNNIVIDTLEGQLITLLVVISFILVFLIREWVVQQQPAVNLDEGERAAVVHLIAENQPNQEGEARINEPQDNSHQNDGNPAAGRAELEHATGGSHHEGSDPFEVPIASDDNVAEGNDRSPFDTETAQPTGAEQSVPRPTLQSRNAPGASHIRRTIEENSASLGNQRPGPEIIKDLWNRGGGDPDQVLRIIQEEGRQEELGWVVTAMTRLQRPISSQIVFGNDHRIPGSQIDGPEDEAVSLENANGTVTSAAPDERYNIPLRIGRRESDDDISPLSSTLFADEVAEEASYIPSLQLSSSAPERFDDDEFAMQPRHPFPESLLPANNADTRERSVSVGRSDQMELEGYPEENPENAADRHPDSTSMVGITAVGGQSSGDSIRPAPVETAAPVPQGMVDQIFDWLWGDVALLGGQGNLDQDEEHRDDPAEEPPFVPAEDRRPAANGEEPVDNQGQEPMFGPAALDPNDANDLDAVEEGDDLDGIMELIGMQGPIFGLLQNCVFSALLISFTVAVGIWLPYLWGKIALVFLTNPVQLFVGVPLALISIIADVAADTLIGSVGYIMYWVSTIIRFLLFLVRDFLPLVDWIPKSASLTNTSLSLIDGSSQRLKRIIDSFFTFHESDLPFFSVISHQALRIHEARIVGLLHFVGDFGKFLFRELPLRIFSQGFRPTLLYDISAMGVAGLFTKLRQLTSNLNKSSLASINLDWITSKVIGNNPVRISLDYDLARWDTNDRIIAIIIGYVFASILGLLYLRITGLISGVNRGQRIEGFVADVLHQAGGVMKVILIIGIEMIVFPLYCGLLLNFALMPLFENATLTSRIDFTIASPLTSLFVHWFVGTCYMFHFALFVSMCRKIMRTGVLYFIRDPDDPTFHPVRDVLERNVMTQLRKIAFSALVYGALVLVCLGGVVWGLSFAFDRVLPIHWSSDVPVLEFPVDLLFYNFVMPLAIRFLKPSDDLHSMYKWWFRKCARLLRLTYFLFGERCRDEEGHHVRRSWRSWRDLLLGKKGDTEVPVINDEQRAEVEKEVVDVYFLRDGKFVRTPASDQVRIPKGGQVFLEVTEDDKRIDGASDIDGLHGHTRDMFTKVYIPPLFKMRIALFIFLIWVFAAITGVSITIIPLVIGRRMIRSCFPGPARVNDIYAFSVGLYTVGGTVYALFYCRTGFTILRERFQPYVDSPRRAIPGACNIVLQALRLIYISVAFAIFLPSLFALLAELYVLVPLHTYLESEQTHIIHFIQDWTLGVLYIQMALKFILWQSTSRPALALKAIVRDGWLKPNVSLATRAILLPVSVIALFAIMTPLCLGFMLNTTIFYSVAGTLHSKVYRYAYPATLLVGLLMWILFLLRRQIDVWRTNIRDDVYLIGERLHNFGEKRARDVGVPRRVITS
ncbi:hypothetical protein V8E54_003587 [Elaphomyces granulatus]